MAKHPTHAGQSETIGERLVFQPADRNKGPILDVLKDILPDTGCLIEIGAGSGQHAAHFAAHFSNLTWQATEPDEKLRRSISAWIDHAELKNALPPIDLDTRQPEWPVEAADAVLCINVIHISPWDACAGLIEGAGKILDKGGILYLYGPFSIDGVHTSPGNADFDKTLKERDAAYGVRELNDVTKLAAEQGFKLERTVDMPNNNLSVIYRKAGR